MKCYGLWDGGVSYAPSDPTEDLEEFPSIDYAMAVFNDRYHNWAGKWRGPYETPCVDRDTTQMWLMFHKPETGDVYPDRIIRFGPRGGIRVEKV